MSGSASLTLEQGILQHTLGIAALAFPAQVYVALCAAGLPPSESVGGVEAFGGSYNRVAATFALLASPTNIAANTQSVEFPLATADWGSLGYFEIWTAQTGGSRLYWGGLVDPVSGNATTLDVSAGDIVRFSAGTLAVEVASATTVVAPGVSSFNTRTGDVILSNSDVVAVLPPSANPPLMDGVAAVGTSAMWARGDHVHPSDAGIAANAAAAGHNVGRNLLHNPLFNVAQRGAGPWITLGTYTNDRWFQNGTLDGINYSDVALLDSDRAQIGDELANVALQNVFAGNAGASAYSFLVQYIEGVRRLSGKTATVSFWARSNVALKLGLNIYQSFGTGGSPSAGGWISTTGQSVTLTTAWARFSATFAIPSASGKTIGTNANDSHGLSFFYSSGATNNAAAGNVGVQSGTIQLWGVQLEIGSVATPLEKPDPRYDLANCQRFYQTGYILSAASGQTAGATFQASALFPVTMRAAPTLGAFSSSNVNITGFTVNTIGAGIGVYFSGTATATGATSFNSGFIASADL